MDEEIFLRFDPNANTWFSERLRNGQVETLIRGPTLEFVMQNSAIVMGRPVFVKASVQS